MKSTSALGAALTIVVLGGTILVPVATARTEEPVILSIYQPAQPDDMTLEFADDAQCGTEGCCEMAYCGPRWTVGVGAVIKQRNGMLERPLAEAEDGSTLMSSPDLDVGWGYGPWIEIIRHCDNGLDFEVEYFSIDNFSETAVAYNGTPIAGEWYWEQWVYDELRATYSNEIYSLELNVKWPLCESGRWKGLAGFRWMELQEELYSEVALTNWEPPPDVLTQWGRLSLNNHLYGLQLGAEGIFWEPCRRFRLEGFAKAGLYGNNVDWSLETGGDLDTRHYVKGECQSAFVSDIGLLAVYKWCCCRKIFAGYEALHFKEVATADVQQKTGPWERYNVRLDHAFFHGFMVGIEMSFGKRCCCRSPEPSCGCE